MVFYLLWHTGPLVVNAAWNLFNVLCGCHHEKLLHVNQSLYNCLTFLICDLKWASSLSCLVKWWHFYGGTAEWPISVYPIKGNDVLRKWWFFTSLCHGTLSHCTVKHSSQLKYKKVSRLADLSSWVNWTQDFHKLTWLTNLRQKDNLLFFTFTGCNVLSCGSELSMDPTLFNYAWLQWWWAVYSVLQKGITKLLAFLIGDCKWVSLLSCLAPHLVSCSLRKPCWCTQWKEHLRECG